MRILYLHDTKINRREMQQVQGEFNAFVKEHAGIDVVSHDRAYDYTDYPTYTDSDGDQRPTPTFLHSLKDIAHKSYRDTVDHIVVWVHEDNWKSDPAGPGGIWGTNYSFIYGSYQVHYCRYDRDNTANTFGTLWHEISHAFDAFIKTYANFDIVTLFPGMTNWDRDMTHGGCCGHDYIRWRHNADALEVIAPKLREAYAERHKIADKEMALFVSLLKQLVVLLRMLLNKKNGVSKQQAPDNTMSKNAAGIVALFLSVIGLEVTEDSIMEVISAVGTIVGFGLMIWNQLGRPDVKGFFFKK